jgi:hypothetical protein
MNKLSAFLSMGIVLALLACNGQEESKTEQQDVKVEESTAENVYYYTCPMEDHKNIVSDKPGKCPDCGMNLVAVVETTADSADFYACPMSEHSQQRFDKPGNCPECNMKLVPMKEKHDEGR